MIIINKTPHAIALIGGDGGMRIIEKSGAPVRVETEPSAVADTIEGVPVFAPPRVKGIANLPAPRDDTVYVVSQIAALAISAIHPDRTDVLYPGTGPGDHPKRIGKQMLAATRLIRAS